MIDGRTQLLMLEGGEDRVKKTFNINAECDRTNKIVTQKICLTFKLLKNGRF